LIIEIMVERGYGKSVYNRIGFIALTPVWGFFGMFFFNALVCNIAQLMGPIQQISMNSKYYSAVKSKRITRDLPHVTIQMPVYKEGLQAVIVPTIQSIKAAISTYELQGGSANIFINDDGFQLFDDQKREERVDFYRDHGIGWIARPPHSNEKDGFKRAGKFKKASNMNYALNISCAMEEKLQRMERTPDWSASDEGEATEWALEQTLKEGGDAAFGAGNVRVGDYILIIDSDTRVPKDCLLDAVSELQQSPEVAILQFSSGVMQISHNYFENGITFFTNLVYSAIRYATANGCVAPFVGHNAVLRWSAVQEVAFEENGLLKFWSESHVSEDFDMALRLQIKGYISRLAAWAGDGFKEGVSLTVWAPPSFLIGACSPLLCCTLLGCSRLLITVFSQVYDELARWQKYAYGCNELVFHPIRFWIIRGPFTPLFKSFLWSAMPLASKINIVAYVGTYYAIASAWILTVVNYFIIGWFKGCKLSPFTSFMKLF
jgi:cellulose synthase/poly-beta-1,6-N-acetylglucosamine synthase-like glycosyltransferase